MSHKKSPAKAGLEIGRRAVVIWQLSARDKQELGADRLTQQRYFGFTPGHDRSGS